MHFLKYADISFNSNANIRDLCEELNNIFGESIWYDSFRIEIRKSLWFVNVVIVAAMNSNKILCGSFGLCPSFVDGILNAAEEINFYALCTKS
jgi:hypothetical protein